MRCGSCEEEIRFITVRGRAPVDAFPIWVLIPESDEARAVDLEQPKASGWLWIEGERGGGRFVYATGWLCKVTDSRDGFRLLCLWRNHFSNCAARRPRACPNCAGPLRQETAESPFEAWRCSACGDRLEGLEESPTPP